MTRMQALDQCVGRIDMVTNRKVELTEAVTALVHNQETIIAVLRSMEEDFIATNKNFALLAHQTGATYTPREETE